MSDETLPPYVHAEQPVFYNVGAWLKENEESFQPPVCNKMMHNYQLKVFYVGGRKANERKDYHLEEGEELFYMREGDMCLKVLEGGKFRDVVIKEGELFLLPGRIPHSPQRTAGTMGLVVERERLHEEKDCLRYFVQDGSTSSLFERWFYCADLGSQLGPVIKEYFASEQHRTGNPIPSDIPANPPWIPDTKRRVGASFSFAKWLDANSVAIEESGSVDVFDRSNYQSEVTVIGGAKEQTFSSNGGETFIWQVSGESTFTINGGETLMKADETLLVPAGAKYGVLSADASFRALTCKMDPDAKKRMK